MIHEVDALNEAFLKFGDTVDYSTPVLRTAHVCEKLLSTYLLDRGAPVNDNGTIGEKRITVFAYINKAKTDIPNECVNYIQIIRQSRNKSAHGAAISYGEMLSFKEAFDCFASWFLLNVLKSDSRKDQDIVLLKTLEDKLEDAGIVIEFSEEEQHQINQQIRLAAYAGMLAAQKEKTIRENRLEYEAAVLAKLDSILTDLGEKDKKLEDIKDSVDVLAEEVRKLSERIEGYQSLVERQLKLAVDKDEMERILHAYVDECSDRIVKEFRNSYGQKEVEIEENKLISLLGANAWGKLQESSKSFLISARVMYNSMVGMRSKSDYSGVCVLVTKALEVELNQRFYKGFVGYLKENYPGKSNMKKWPMGLLDENEKQLDAGRFSLGNISEIMCRWHDPRADEERQKNNREKLLDYAQDKLFRSLSREEIFDLLQEYAEDVEIIKNKYRNPSAHTGEVTQTNAKDCFDIVLDVEKLLKRMLDSFDKEEPA